MFGNESGRRTAALVCVMLLASMFVLYTTAPAISGRPSAVFEIPAPKGEQALPMIASALRENKFYTARALSHRLPNAVPDEQIAAEMRQVVDFLEARHALTIGDALTASSVAKTMPAGLKRALLWTAIAASQEAARDRNGALANLRLALKDAGQVAGNDRRPLMVMIARVLLQLDVEKGLDVLDSALHEREAASAMSGAAWVGIAGDGFYESISAGGPACAFSLSAPGLRGNAEELVLAYHGRLRCKHRMKA